MCTACIGRLCDEVPGFGVVSVNLQGPGPGPLGRQSAGSSCQLGGSASGSPVSVTRPLKVSFQL